MKTKIWMKWLNVFASLALFAASISINQCSLSAIYQIPVNDKLKKKIIASKKI